MNVRKSGLSILAVAMVAGAIGVGAALTGGEPQWRKALNIRSEALNRQHGLGETARTTAQVERPAWLRALMTRSEALNSQHGLGRYSRKPASAKAPQWLQALMIRSDALNRQHKLGEYAPGS